MKDETDLINENIKKHLENVISILDNKLAKVLIEQEDFHMGENSIIALSLLLRKAISSFSKQNFDNDIKNLYITKAYSSDLNNAVEKMKIAYSVLDEIEDFFLIMVAKNQLFKSGGDIIKQTEAKH